MKIKKISLVALGLCSVLAIAGCKKDPATSTGATSGNAQNSGNTQSSSSSSKGYVIPTVSQENAGTKGAKVDIMINYKKSDSLSYGVSYTGASAYSNPIEKSTYQPGDILPTWKEFGKMNGVEIRDVADYSVHTDDNQYDKIYVSPTSGTKFVTTVSSNNDKGQTATVDLWMNSASNMDKVAANGDLLNLLKYLDNYMPNFKKWLYANPEVAKQLINDKNEMYVVPYFDGKDSIEKMFLMDTNMTKKLLDDDSAVYDTTDTITTSYEKFLPKYQNEKIAVVGLEGKKADITVTSSENIIDKQNALTVKNGQTLTTALKDYLKATYGEYVGPGKLYEHLSDIYVSKSACYNADELVALMRCVKTNSKLLTGTTDKKVTVLSPREDKNSRANNVVQFASIWGIQGLTSEKDYLYFDAKGELHDARTEEETYTVGLANLHKLYSEGLILENYATKINGKTNFAKTLIPQSQLFMEYDYNATSAQYNAPDEFQSGTSGSKTDGFMPVLSPVTIWKEDDHTTYNYTRHSEDTRALKSGGWVVPKNSDNIAGALAVIDSIFTTEGANLQDFGPAAYRDGDKTVTLPNGVVAPKINPLVLEDIYTGDNKSLGWNNWYRCFVGSTQGIGHVRNDALDYQVTNASGQTGLNNVTAAIATGVMSLAVSTNPNGFNKCVPTFWSLSSTDNENLKASEDNTYFTTLWKSDMSYTGYHGIVRDGLTADKLSEIKGHFEKQNQVYLETYKLYLV